MTSQRADLALVERRIFESRQKAQEAIAAGLVRVDGKTLRKPSERIKADACVDAAAPYPWVSRGGVKLAAALDCFGFDPAGLPCLDIGASTGGFTHVLLDRGALSVAAVDVGRFQLHPDIARDPRVVSLESTDARGLSPAAIPAPPLFLTFDVSFISLALVLPAVLPLAGTRARLVALIKPQFEVGPGRAVKGIVKDEALRAKVCANISALIESLGWTVLGLVPSPIEGGDGNVEYLIGAQRT
ncbi:TlyA family RNA methyltransferase [Methylocapsa palsarum]|uniref:23S rRNA (Cytidine1920-2'-O)/16S rRNA (Cytidine1409-2'-O)-methyltransferase n=1 Tax=Methylocapsa palsarum TaxID=1612308 RepID=A0A1I3WU38_9HYPH|nr:TlyA family RNA methyltransferase [Methylocapsa palsarum]SFK10367.1 23S rRNA (cytidine1920-2'-O)/16S rRNA (cytidine1409-2'-O)-methyltransferase [Methylocapsa palsarum]